MDGDQNNKFIPVIENSQAYREIGKNRFFGNNPVGNFFNFQKNFKNTPLRK